MKMNFLLDDLKSFDHYFNIFHIFDCWKTGPINVLKRLLRHLVQSDMRLNHYWPYNSCFLTLKGLHKHLKNFDWIGFTIPSIGLCCRFILPHFSVNLSRIPKRCRSTIFSLFQNNLQIRRGFLSIILLWVIQTTLTSLTRPLRVTFVLSVSLLMEYFPREIFPFLELYTFAISVKVPS